MICRDLMETKVTLDHKENLEIKEMLDQLVVQEHKDLLDHL